MCAQVPYADRPDRVLGRGDGSIMHQKFTGIALFVNPALAEHVTVLGVDNHSFGAPRHAAARGLAPCDHGAVRRAGKTEGSKGGVGVAVRLYTVTMVRGGGVGAGAGTGAGAGAGVGRGGAGICVWGEGERGSCGRR